MRRSASAGRKLLLQLQVQSPIFRSCGDDGRSLRETPSSTSGDSAAEYLSCRRPLRTTFALAVYASDRRLSCCCPPQQSSSLREASAGAPVKLSMSRDKDRHVCGGRSARKLAHRRLALRAGSGRLDMSHVRGARAWRLGRELLRGVAFLRGKQRRSSAVLRSVETGLGRASEAWGVLR